MHPAPFLPKNCFEPFSQADSSINRRKGGHRPRFKYSQRLARGLDGEIKGQKYARKGNQAFSF